jgi:hypothetical protein
VHLFRSGRAAGTIVLWFVNFMNILVVYSLANWLATVLGDAGYATRTAVLISTTLQAAPAGAGGRRGRPRPGGRREKCL